MITISKATRSKLLALHEASLVASGNRSRVNDDASARAAAWNDSVAKKLLGPALAAKQSMGVRSDKSKSSPSIATVPYVADPCILLPFLRRPRSRAPMSHSALLSALSDASFASPSSAASSSSSAHSSSSSSPPPRHSSLILTSDIGRFRSFSPLPLFSVAQFYFDNRASTLTSESDSTSASAQSSLSSSAADAPSTSLPSLFAQKLTLRVRDDDAGGEKPTESRRKDSSISNTTNATSVEQWMPCTFVDAPSSSTATSEAGTQAALTGSDDATVRATTTSTSMATTTSILPPRVLPSGASLHKIRASTSLPHWRTGAEQMSFVFGQQQRQQYHSSSSSSSSSAAFANYFTVFDGLALWTPPSVAQAFVEHRLQKSSVIVSEVQEKNSDATASHHALLYWSRKLRAAFPIPASCLDAVTPELLPCMWWFFVWIHRNHTMHILSPNLRRMLFPVQRGKKNKKKKSHSTPYQQQQHKRRLPHMMICRGARDADKLGQEESKSSAMFAGNNNCIAATTQQSAVTGKKENKSVQLPPLSLLSSATSAHDFVLKRLERQFGFLKARQIALLVRHLRVFLEYVDVAACNRNSKKSQESDQLLLKINKAKLKAADVSPAAPSSPSSSLSPSLVNVGSGKRLRLHRQHVLSHSSCVTPRDAFFSELRLWREWRLLYSFFPILALRVAVCAAAAPVVADASALDGVQNSSNAGRNGFLHHQQLKPLSPFIALPESESPLSMMRRLAESVGERGSFLGPHLTKSSHDGCDDADDDDATDPSLAIVIPLKLTPSEVAQLRHRSGWTVFRSSLPCLLEHDDHKLVGRLHGEMLSPSSSSLPSSSFSTPSDESGVVVVGKVSNSNHLTEQAILTQLPHLWRHFNVTGYMAGQIWSRLLGQQRSWFDTRDFHRASGERSLSGRVPFFVFVRECIGGLSATRRAIRARRKARAEALKTVSVSLSISRSSPLSTTTTTTTTTIPSVADNKKKKEQQVLAAQMATLQAEEAADAKAEAALPRSIGEMMAFAKRKWTAMHPVEQSKYYDTAVIRSVFPEFAGFRREDVERIKQDDEMMTLSPLEQELWLELQGSMMMTQDGTIARVRETPLLLTLRYSPVSASQQPPQRPRRT